MLLFTYLLNENRRKIRNNLLKKLKKNVLLFLWDENVASCLRWNILMRYRLRQKLYKTKIASTMDKVLVNIFNLNLFTILYFEIKIIKTF